MKKILLFLLLSAAFCTQAFGDLTSEQILLDHIKPNFNDLVVVKCHDNPNNLGGRGGSQCGEKNESIWYIFYALVDAQDLQAAALRLNFNISGIDSSYQGGCVYAKFKTSKTSLVGVIDTVYVLYRVATATNECINSQVSLPPGNEIIRLQDINTIEELR